MSDVQQCKDSPGIPPNPMPFWSHFPLLNKLPVPSNAPAGTVILYNGQIGETLWKTDRVLDFDLTDPNNYNYPATQEYNSLLDDHLRAYMSNSRVTKILLRQGLITRDGHVYCQLRTYNQFRVYLHRLNTRIIKQRSENDEAKLIKRMMNATLNKVHSAQSDNGALKVQYSGMLNEEAPNIEDANDQALADELVTKGFSVGEVNWCKWLNRLLQEDCRKAALMRLRRIQLYADRQRRRWVDWRKRNLFDMEWLEMEALRKQQLETERLMHIEHHKRFAAGQQERMLARIRRYAEDTYNRQRRVNRTVAHYVCRKTCRVWPLSARCPRNVLVGTCGVTQENVQTDKYGSKGDLYDYVQQMVFAKDENMYGSSTPSHRRSKGKKRATPSTTADGTEREVTKTADMQTVLTQLIIKNTVDLLARTATSDGNHLDRVGPPIEPHEIIDHIEGVVKDEMHHLSKESPDVLLVIKDRLIEQAMLGDEKKHADWENAPALKSAQSLTGLYITETMADVVQQMQTEGLLTGTMRELPAESQIAQPSTEVTLHSNAEDILRLPGGQEMMELATQVVKTGHRTLPGETGEQQWHELSACLISNLMRTTLLELRTAMRNGQIGDSDLPELAQAVEVDDLEADAVGETKPHHGARHAKKPHEAVRQKVAQQGTLLSSGSIANIVNKAVDNVKNEPHREDVDDAVRGHVEEAARELVEKIVDDIFADIDPARSKADEPENHP